jgi:predicted nucleic acid-binding protein
MVLLDANVLVYYLDETADHYSDTIQKLQELVDAQEQLITSHHILEEVLFILSKYDYAADLEKAVERIAAIPELMLIEPSPHIDFAKRYATLSKRLNMGINDALLLQLMLDAGISQLFSYDKKFVNKAKTAGIEKVA